MVIFINKVAIISLQYYLKVVSIFEILSERVKFEGANLVIEGAGSQGNLLSGSMFIGNTLLSGIEAGGGNSAFIRSLGYFGFDKAESIASG